MQPIHSTAVVSPESWLDKGVEVGPYSIIGPKVKIGRGSRISSHVRIDGDTEIGQDCVVFHGAAIGGAAQARRTESANSRVRIGDGNVIREFVTIHAAMKDGARTVIGDRNMFMATSHVGHDCVLGDDIILANSVALGGHVEVGDKAVIGGLSGVHQFVRIGPLAMVGGLSKVIMDVPPFSMADGRPAGFCGINAVGLKRAGFTSSRAMAVKKALKRLFADRVNLSKAAAEVRREFKNNPDIEVILAFVERSKRGVGRSRVVASETD